MKPLCSMIGALIEEMHKESSQGGPNIDFRDWRRLPGGSDAYTWE